MTELERLGDFLKELRNHLKIKTETFRSVMTSIKNNNLDKYTGSDDFSGRTLKEKVNILTLLSGEITRTKIDIIEVSEEIQKLELNNVNNSLPPNQKER